MSIYCSPPFSAIVLKVKVLQFDRPLRASNWAQTLGIRWSLVLVVSSVMSEACGDTSKSHAPQSKLVRPAVGLPVAAPPAATHDAVAPPREAAPAAVSPDDEPPELTALKVRVIAGDRSSRTMKELQKLSHRYPKNAEIAYILGQFYCDKLWMNDCLTYFQKAIELDGTFRTNPALIKAAVAGLGNDSDHAKVAQFLVQQIGLLAAPDLEDVLDGTWRKQVKDRAADILRQLK